MFGIGMPELILLVAIALIVIGPKKLPDMARTLGRAMREFKKATNDFKESIQLDEDLSEVKKAFNGLGDDIKESIGPAKNSDEFSRPGESEPAEDRGEDKEPNAGDAVKADSGDSLDNVKQAFDQLKDSGAIASEAESESSAETEKEESPKAPDKDDR